MIYALKSFTKFLKFRKVAPLSRAFLQVLITTLRGFQTVSTTHKFFDIIVI